MEVPHSLICCPFMQASAFTPVLSLIAQPVAAGVKWQGPFSGKPSLPNDITSPQAAIGQPDSHGSTCGVSGLPGAADGLVQVGAVHPSACTEHM